MVRCWSYPRDTDMGINVLGSQSRLIRIVSSFRLAMAKVRRSSKSPAAAIVFLQRRSGKNINMKNKFNSSVLHERPHYGLDEGIRVMPDVSTGTRKWKGGRYGYGQVILAGGHLIITSDAVDLALVKATPDQYTEVARFKKRWTAKPGIIRRLRMASYWCATRRRWPRTTSPRSEAESIFRISFLISHLALTFRGDLEGGLA